MNKKVFVGICGVMIFVFCIAAILFFVLKNGHKEEDWVSVLGKEFAGACGSEELMNRFVDDYFDLRAVYAITEISDSEEFAQDEGAYENAFLEKYNKADEAGVDGAEIDIKSIMREFVSKDDKVVFKSVDQLERYDEIPVLDKADLVFAVGEDEADVAFYLYGKKLVLVEIEAVY